MNMRLDHVASVWLAHPISRLLTKTIKQRIPILMYHKIQEDRGERHPYYETSTSPQMFAEQMKCLHDRGYQTISLDKMGECLSLPESDRKQVVLTFDDGYRSVYTEASSVLAQYGFRATVYLATAFISNDTARGDGAEYLSWQEVRQLRDQGIEIGSHTVNHPDLRSLDRAHAEHEICASKLIIEDKIGQTVKHFAYPFAFPETDKRFTTFFADALRRSGYETGVSTIIGRASIRHNRFVLPRLPANSWDDRALFRAKLEGGYDWLHAPQYVAKLIEASLR